MKSAGSLKDTKNYQTERKQCMVRKMQGVLIINVYLLKMQIDFLQLPARLLHCGDNGNTFKISVCLIRRIPLHYCDLSDSCQIWRQLRDI